MLSKCPFCRSDAKVFHSVTGDTLGSVFECATQERKDGTFDQSSRCLVREFGRRENEALNVKLLTK